MTESGRELERKREREREREKDREVCVCLRYKISHELVREGMGIINYIKTINYELVPGRIGSAGRL